MPLEQLELLLAVLESAAVSDLPSFTTVVVTQYCPVMYDDLFRC